MAQQDAQTGAPAPAPQPPINLRTLIIGIVAALAGGAGVDAAGYKPDPQWIQALGIGGAAMLIGYLHFVWLPLFRAKGTTLDEIKVTTTETKSMMAELLKRLPPVALVVVLLLAPSACGWLKREGRETTSNVVDCSTAKAKDAIKQFAPTVEQLIANTLDTAGRADWNMIESATKDFAVDVGGCVLASSVSRLLESVVALGAPSSSPLELDKVDLEHSWNELRAKRYSGARFEGAGP